MNWIAIGIGMGMKILMKIVLEVGTKTHFWMLIGTERVFRIEIGWGSGFGLGY